MSNKNWLSGREKELHELAEQYETAMAEERSLYLDAEDIADLADWYGNRKKIEKAYELSEYGLKLHPNNESLLIEYAYLCVNEGRVEKAEELIQHFPEGYSSAVKVIRAHLLLHEGNLEACKQQLASIDDKKDLSSIIEVAYMYMEMGYPEESFAWLEPNIERYPDDIAFLATLADYYTMQGMSEKAAPLYNKLIDKDPYSAPYWFGLAKCRFYEGKFGEAIEACDYTLISDEEYVEAYVMKGNCFDQLDNPEAALEAYRQGVQYGAFSPEFLDVYLGLNKIYKQEWKEGCELLEKAIKNNRGDELFLQMLPNIYAQAAIGYAHIGEKLKAHNYCQIAYDMNPADPIPLILEGRIYIEEGKREEGFAKWQEAMEYPNQINILYEIGLQSIEVEEFEYAKDVFKQLHTLNTEFEDVNEKLTILYLLFDEEEEAIRHNLQCLHPLSDTQMTEIQNLFRTNKAGASSQLLKELLGLF